MKCFSWISREIIPFSIHCFTEEIFSSMGWGVQFQFSFENPFLPFTDLLTGWICINKRHLSIAIFLRKQRNFEIWIEILHSQVLTGQVLSRVLRSTIDSMTVRFRDSKGISELTWMWLILPDKICYIRVIIGNPLLSLPRIYLY